MLLIVIQIVIVVSDKISIQAMDGLEFPSFPLIKSVQYRVFLRLLSLLE